MISIKELEQPDKNGLADYLPWSFLSAEGVVENKDGSLQKSFHFRGPDLDSATKRELMGVSGAFNNALRRLGDGWAVFIEAQRNPIEDYPECSWPNEASRVLDNERKQFFKAADNCFANDYFLTLVYKPPITLESKSKWFVHRHEASQDTSQSLKGFLNTIGEVEGLLAGLLPVLKPLNDDETLTYLHSTVSSKRHPIKTPDMPMYLDHILCDESVEHGLGLRLGNNFVRTLSIKSFPSESYPGILDAINDLAFPFRWSTRFICLGQDSAKKSLTTIRRMWFAGRMDAVERTLDLAENQLNPRPQPQNDMFFKRGAVGKIKEPLPHMVSEGTLIPAILLSEIDTTLPGPILARVSNNIWDSKTGQTLLIPQNSQLIGEYDSSIGQGQTRAQIVWKRIIFPNQQSVNLGSMVGVDKRGTSGTAGSVDNHYDKVVLGLLLTTALSGSMRMTQGQYDPHSASISQEYGNALAQETARLGNKITDKMLSIPPTIKVPMGQRLNVFVEQDLSLQPYSG